MVWNKLLPSAGGGGLRRFLQVRKDLFTKRFFPKHRSDDYDLPLDPLTLFDFSRLDDAADVLAVSTGPTKGGWRVSDDEVIGGYSRAKMGLVDHRLLDSSSNGEEVEDEPFIRWKGNLDTRIGPSSRARRSGFCAIRSPEFFGGVPIGNSYNALEIKCRVTDGRTYTVNLKVSSYFPDDLYQGIITTDDQQKQYQQEQEQQEGTEIETANSTTINSDGDFVRLIMPFRQFVLTSSGRVREQQRALDGAIELESLGITLMDGVDGPFQFDLSRIRAVNMINGEVFGDDDDNNHDTDSKDESIMKESIVKEQ